MERLSKMSCAICRVNFESEPFSRNFDHAVG